MYRGDQVLQGDFQPRSADSRSADGQHPNHFSAAGAGADTDLSLYVVNCLS